MRNTVLLTFAVLTPMVITGGITRVAGAASLEVTFITQYCNETIQTTDLSTDPRMLRNISNSLMTAAPDYLDESIYMQRRSNFTDFCPELNGIGETSSEWLRANRITVSEPAIVIAAVREQFYPGAGALLTSLGWTPLGDTITLNYVSGVANVPLYAGLIPAGEVQISGSGVNLLRNGGDENTASHYFFFQDSSALPPEVLAQLQVVSVPEPDMSVLLLIGATLLLIARQSGLHRRGSGEYLRHA